MFLLFTPTENFRAFLNDLRWKHAPGNDTVTDTVVDWSWNYMQIIPFLAPATRLQRLGTYVKLSQSFRRPQNFQLWSELRKITHDGTIRCLGIELSRTWDGTTLEVVVLTITSIYIYRLWMPETHILRCGVVFSIDLDSRSHDRVEKQFRSFRDTFFFHNHIMNLAKIIIFYYIAIIVNYCPPTPHI